VKSRSDPPPLTRVGFRHWLGCTGGEVPEAIYLPSKPWNVIIHLCAKGTFERAVPEMMMGEEFRYLVTFTSFDRAALKLFYTHHTGEVECEMKAILEGRIPRIFSQAFRRAIREVTHYWPASGIFASEAETSL